MNTAIEPSTKPQRPPFDFPTGIGAWAFRGDHKDKKGIERAYHVVDYTDCLDADEAPFPAIRLAGDSRHLWWPKFYLDKGPYTQPWIGEWWPLVWPWDFPQVPVVDWSKAPAHATHHVFMREGYGRWLQAYYDHQQPLTPYSSGGGWEHAIYLEASGLSLLHVIADWQTTLEARPKSVDAPDQSC